MDEKKAIYSVCNDIWGLVKKYGCTELTDEQWKQFVDSDGYALQEKYRKVNQDIELLMRDMFWAVQEYYIRKKESRANEEWKEREKIRYSTVLRGMRTGDSGLGKL